MRTASSLLKDFCICLSFFTRLSCPFAAAPEDPAALGGFSRAVRMLPLAGGAIGAAGAVVLAAASILGLPAQLAAPLAIAALAAITGAIHEDGLADCADGFFGASIREKKLDIMRDSRIGAYGAVALALAVYLRAASLALISQTSLALACAALISGAALSRTAALLPLALLPPARTDGAGFGAGKPAPRALATATVVAALFALAPVIAGGRLLLAAAGAGLAAASSCGVALLARRHIGGQTGDVAGAAQQLSEIVYYLALTVRG